jgi:hypothetical protein
LAGRHQQCTKLHYLAYYPVKYAHPTLISDLINTARAKASEALKSAVSLRKQGRTVSMLGSICQFDSGTAAV